MAKSAPHTVSRVDGRTDTPDAGTRNFPRFELDDPSLTGFVDYLQGIDGGQKSLKSAQEATVDVSKFLQLVGVTVINWLIFVHWLDFLLEYYTGMHVELLPLPLPGTD